MRGLGAIYNATPESAVVSIVEPGGFNTIDRADTVAQILEDTRGEPILWLHGSIGTGKSTLAQLVAGQMQGLWLALDLRLFQGDGRAALAAWAELRRAISREQQRLRGILIDDLSATAHDALQGKLVGFLSSIASLSTRVIITANFVPSPARVAELGASPRAIVRAPYFKEHEVRALISLRDPPLPELIQGWSQLLLVTTYGGHPTLMTAKIATLRARAWPLSALSEDLGPYASEAVRVTREEARRRLVDELPSADLADSVVFSTGQTTRLFSSSPTTIHPSQTPAISSRSCAVRGSNRFPAGTCVFPL